MGTNMYISLVYFEQKCDDFDYMLIESTEGSTLHCKVQEKRKTISVVATCKTNRRRAISNHGLSMPPQPRYIL